jgi:hypothetical protein
MDILITLVNLVSLSGRVPIQACTTTTIRWRWWWWYKLVPVDRPRPFIKHSPPEVNIDYRLRRWPDFLNSM